VLEACIDGVIVLRARTLDYGLRCKLAAIVVNHLIQNKQPKGCEFKLFSSLRFSKCHKKQECADNWHKLLLAYICHLPLVLVFLKQSFDIFNCFNKLHKLCCYYNPAVVILLFCSARPVNGDVEKAAREILALFPDEKMVCHRKLGQCLIHFFF
jgi:hypothetical protein